MPRPRRHDPHRRERIVEAAVGVLRAHGVAGLSHRAVAAAADVPLGSTTYHFAGRDDLLTAALERVTDAFVAHLADRLTTAALAGRPLADELAAHVADCVGPRRAATVLEYDLYAAGLTRPALRPLAARCLDRVTALLRPYVPDAATARALLATVDGTIVRLLLTGRDADPDELRAVFGQLLAGAPPAGPRAPGARGDAPAGGARGGGPRSPAGGPTG